MIDDIFRISRSFRAHMAVTDRIVFRMSNAERIRLRLELDGYAVAVPDDVARAKREGWCRVDDRRGYAAVALPVPLNLRDEAGEAVGEVVAWEDRGGDLWALLLWRRDGEELEAFAHRVRMAGVLRNVPHEIDVEAGAA